jgi:hypothetical protein
MALLGADGAGLAHVVRVCCTLLSGSLKDLEIEQELSARLAGLLRHLQQEQGGASMLEGVLNSMPPKQQKKVRTTVASS